MAQKSWMIPNIQAPPPLALTKLFVFLARSDQFHPSDWDSCEDCPADNAVASLLNGAIRGTQANNKPHQTKPTHIKIIYHVTNQRQPAKRKNTSMAKVETCTVILYDCAR